MNVYKTNMPKKILESKDQFTYLSNNFDINKNQQKIRNNSHKNFMNRPTLIKNIKRLLIEKNDLENIGDDDQIFNNDKLISSIQIDSYENNSKKNSLISLDKNDLIFTPNNRKKNMGGKNNKNKNKNKTKNFSSSSLDTFDLNCNKMSYNNSTNKLSKNRGNHSASNFKKCSSPTKSKNMNKKKVDQFINKPRENRKKLNQNILNTSINSKSTYNQNNKKLTKNNFLHNSNQSFLDNNIDTISLSSNSRLNITRSCIRGRSMPSKSSNKSQSNLHLPNKSIIKNQDKVMIELQKLFGERIQLTDDINENMTDVDKKNCINFLLETIKELININKITKSKMEGYKQINESKEQQIKSFKNEIKGLKKEILKLNKVIRTNTQQNKKLSQNVENLKLKLEKEIIKNKALQSKGRSTSKSNNLKVNKKVRNGNSVTKNKRHKSQDILKKAKNFVNRQKKDNENNDDKNINNIKKMNNNELIENNISNNINENNEKSEKNKNEVNSDILLKNNEEKNNDISQVPLNIDCSKDQNEEKMNNNNISNEING